MKLLISGPWLIPLGGYVEEKKKIKIAAAPPTLKLPPDLTMAEKVILGRLQSGVAVDKAMLALFGFLEKKGTATSASAATPRRRTMLFGTAPSEKKVTRRVYTVYYTIPHLFNRPFPKYCHLLAALGDIRHVAVGRGKHEGGLLMDIAAA